MARYSFLVRLFHPNTMPASRRSNRPRRLVPGGYKTVPFLRWRVPYVRSPGRPLVHHACSLHLEGMPIVLIMLVAGVVQFVVPASAHALRCGTRLVREGDTRERVRHLCGDPTDVTQRVEERAIRQSLLSPQQAQRNAATFAPSTATTSSAGTSALPTVVPSTDTHVASANALANTRGAFASALMVSVTFVVESWTYNFGPDRAMQRVVFADGVVDQIESLGRGYLAEAESSTGTQAGTTAADDAVLPPGTERRASRSVREGDSRDQVAATWGEPTQVTESMVERAVIQRVSADLAQRASVRVRVERWVYNFGPLRLMQGVVIEDGRVIEVASLGMGY